MPASVTTRPPTAAQFQRALDRAVKAAVKADSPGGATITRAELLGLPQASTFEQQDAWLRAVDQALAGGGTLGRGTDAVMKGARQATHGTLRTVDPLVNARALAPLCAALDQLDRRPVTWRPIASVAALFPPRRFGAVYELPSTPGASFREFVAIPEGTARRPASGFGWDSTVLMPEHGFVVRQAVDGSLTASPLVHLLTDAPLRGTTTAAWPRDLSRTLKTAAAVEAALSSPEAREAVRFAVIVGAVTHGRFTDDASRDAFARLWAQSTLHIESGAQSPGGAPELRVRLQARHPELDEVYPTATALVAFERDGLQVSMLTGVPMLEALWEKAVGAGLF